MAVLICGYTGGLAADCPWRLATPTPFAEAVEVIRALVGQSAPCRCEDPNCEWRRAYAFLERVEGGK